MDADDSSPYKLSEEPGAPAFVELHSGGIFKRGAIMKGWKKRIFVVNSDGSCNYLNKEGDERPKGAVDLSGYTVNAEPSADGFAGKEHYFVLEPREHSGNKPKFLHCESAEEKAKAVAAFTLATRKATGYVNPDPIVGAAFGNAYAKLRQSYSMYSKDPRGKEDHALTEVLYERLLDVVVNQALENVSGAPRHLALKAVKTTAHGLASVAWKVSSSFVFVSFFFFFFSSALPLQALDESTQKLRPKAEETLKKAMTPFVEAENKLKDKILEQGKFTLLLFPLLYSFLKENNNFSFYVSFSR